MVQLFHGTDYESAVDILQNGLREDVDTVWTCSRDDMLYMRKTDEYEDDPYEIEYLSIVSGQIAAAYKGRNDTRIAILVLEMPDDLAEKIVEIDDSIDTCTCDNIVRERTYQALKCDINDGIKNGQIKASINVYDNAYVPYLRPFYLVSLSHEYMVIEDQKLEDAMNVIRKSDAFIDELFTYGDAYETYELKGQEWG